VSFVVASAFLLLPSRSFHAFVGRKKRLRANKQTNTRGLNFYLWAERQAHDDSRSLQWMDSHSVVFCAVSSVQLGSFLVCGQAKAAKPKMRGRKLRSTINWQGR